MFFFKRMIGLVWMAAFTVSAQKAITPQVKQLRADINEYINQKFLENSTWGIFVQSVKNGETLVSVNPKQNFIPASNRKIFTSIFDLAKLGPDFQYSTKVYLQGHFENDSIFTGNVILRGMGDPSISGRFNEGKITAILEAWADSLRARKIKTIHGRIIGDDNFLGDDVLGAYWEWTEESFWYSAQLSGLNFNDNCIDWYVKPTKIGEPAKLILIPNTSYIKVKNSVKTVATASEAKSIELYRRRATNEVEAVGAILAGSDPQHGYVTMENPTLYTATVLREILADRGIVVDTVADIDDLPEFRYSPKDSDVTVIADYRSPKLSELIKIINKNSQNLYAELLWRTVAAVFDSQGTGDHALELEKKFLKETVGLNTEKMSLADGSGYARGNLVSPNDIVTVLKWVRKQPYWNTFWESLPIAGKDGTIKNRMKGTMAEENCRAKTGYLDNVKTISGFVKTLDGEELVFSVMCNNFTGDRYEIDKVQDQIVARLAFFTRN